MPAVCAAACTAQTRDPALADDLVSEAFLRLAIEIREGRSPREPRAWLYRVGSNLLVSRARRTAVATRALPGLLERDVMGSPEDEVITREGHGLVRDGLATLGRTDREIVALAAQGLSNREMASDARLLGGGDPNPTLSCARSPAGAARACRDDRLTCRTSSRSTATEMAGTSPRLSSLRRGRTLPPDARSGDRANCSGSPMHRARRRGRGPDRPRRRRSRDRQDAPGRRVRGERHLGRRPSADGRLPRPVVRRSALCAVRRGSPRSGP